MNPDPQPDRALRAFMLQVLAMGFVGAFTMAVAVQIDIGALSLKELIAEIGAIGIAFVVGLGAGFVVAFVVALLVHRRRLLPALLIVNSASLVAAVAYVSLGPKSMFWPLPSVYPAMAAAVLTAVVVKFAVRDAPLAPSEPTCPECGYALHHLPRPRCPECGWHAVPESRE